jgi:hypothetical protein
LRTRYRENRNNQISSSSLSTSILRKFL